MTHDQIRAAVVADTELRKLAVAGDDGGLAKRLPPDKVDSKATLTSLGALEALGLERGAAVMDAMRASTDPLCKELARHLDGAGIRASHALVAAVLALLAKAESMSQAECDLLQQFAVVDQPVRFDDVSAALRPFRTGGKAGADAWIGG